MGPKPSLIERDFFRQSLPGQISLKHPPVSLAELIDRARLSAAMSEGLVCRAGRPVTSTRLIEGLQWLHHAFDLTDEAVVWQWGLTRGIKRGLRAMIRRPSAIERVTGHMKTDGKLDRTVFPSAPGDAMHAVLCGVSHNLRMNSVRLRFCCSFVLGLLLNSRRSRVVQAFRILVANLIANAYKFYYQVFRKFHDAS